MRHVFCMVLNEKKWLFQKNMVEFCVYIFKISIFPLFLYNPWKFLSKEVDIRNIKEIDFAAFDC